MDSDFKLELITQLPKYWLSILHVTQNYDDLDVDQSKITDFEYLNNLFNIPVTESSSFSDPLWDFNLDVHNPSANIVGAKLSIDFSKYDSIPLPIIIEIKCVFLCCLIVPREFSNRQRTAKRNIKPNTLIGRFKDGLNFINHTLYVAAKKYGSEYVSSKYSSLSDIDPITFKEAVLSYDQKLDTSSRKSFFDVISHMFVREKLNIKVQIQYSDLLAELVNKKESIAVNNDEYAEESNKEEKRNVKFSNEDFNKLVSYSTFKVVDFLLSLNVDVEDKIALNHLSLQDSKYQSCHLTEDMVNDYNVYRLYNKGYSLNEIPDSLHVRDEFLYTRGDGSKILVADGRKFKDIHKVETTDDIRQSLNDIYRSACYLTGQFTGARPNVLSDILISSCLIQEHGDDLIIGEEHKGRDSNYNLFDDSWIAIPIIKDAIKAASIISVGKGTDLLWSSADTYPPNSKRKKMASTGQSLVLTALYKNAVGVEPTGLITPYVMRHTLSYQLYRADVGLPIISYQLKHIVDKVRKYTSFGATSNVTLGYGEIGDKISGAGGKSTKQSLRRSAELELVKTTMNPSGVYLGEKGKAHKKRLQKFFQGYMAAGYTEEEIYEAMVDNGMAVINVGSAFCFGGNENFDESLPCIGTLRCNPMRCSEAIVTKANAPKWREVFFSNKALVGKEGYEDRQDQILATIKEAKAVLAYLGEEIIL